MKKIIIIIIINNNDNKNNNNNIFKLDYESQNVDNNKYFIKWKRLMLEKLGNNAKLIRCSKDKILFFISYDEYKDILKKKLFIKLSKRTLYLSFL